MRLTQTDGSQRAPALPPRKFGGWRLPGLLAAALALTTGCVEKDPPKPSERDYEEINKQLLSSVPEMDHKVNATLEDKVVYLGLDVDKEVVVPGEPFRLTHYWKVLKPVPGWKIFVHLHDTAKRQFVNADHKPVGGRYPATFWKAGEIIRDSHEVSLPTNWSSDKVFVYTGLWQGSLRMKPEGPQDDASRIRAAVLPVQLAKGAKKTAPTPRIVAARATKPVKVDGKLDDPVWQRAPSTGAFVDPTTGGEGRAQTEAKLAWDEKFLYVAFVNRDPDIWSTLDKRDAKLWTQEAVELMIDANADGSDYIELQVNPRGAIFDSYLPAYRKNTDSWQSGLKAAVSVDGTIGKGKRDDKGWNVEMALPWKDAKGKGTYELALPPKPGSIWRINMFRLDRVKKGGTRIAVAWSPPQTGDFHRVERFGELVFGDPTGKGPPAKGAATQPTKATSATKSSAPAPGQAKRHPIEASRRRLLNERIRRGRPKPTSRPRQPPKAAKKPASTGGAAPDRSGAAKQ